MQRTYLSKRIIVALVALVMMAAVMAMPKAAYADGGDTSKVECTIKADGNKILTEFVANNGQYSTTNYAYLYIPKDAKTITVERNSGGFPYDMYDAGEGSGYVSVVEGDMDNWFDRWENATYDPETETFSLPASIINGLGQGQDGMVMEIDDENLYAYVYHYLVNSLTVSGDYKQEYKHGEEFDPTGIVVKGIIDDGKDTEKDLTDYVTFDGFDGSTTGEQTITATYGSVSTTFTVTVAEPTPTDQVVEKIEALPSDVTTDDKEKIDEARAAYDALTDEEKDAFPEAPMAKLEAAEAKLAAAEAEAAKKEAEDKAAAAEKAQKEAEDKAAAAEKAKKDAEDKAAAAEKAKKEAEDKAAAAEKAKKDAEDKAAAAEKAQKDAEAKAKKAEQAKKAAKVAKVNIKKAKGAKKKATITWKKVKGAKGYEIIVAKNKKGTKNALTYNVKGNKATKVIKKLNKGKYFVKVRAYTKYNGNTLHGAWSAAKKVKVK